MTTTTTEKAHPLAALADTLDQLDNDRDRTQLVNRLERLANSATLADVLADAVNECDGPALVLDIERGHKVEIDEDGTEQVTYDRTMLPSIVVLPWDTNRAGDKLSLSFWLDHRDTLRGIVASDGHAVGVMFAGSLPDLGRKNSTTTHAAMLADGTPTGLAMDLSTWRVADDGRVKFLAAQNAAKNGTRGANKSSTV